MELSMIASNMGSGPAEASQKTEATAEGGARRPMSEQNSVHGHGHEMHPQKLVRLVGCHETPSLQRQPQHLKSLSPGAKS
jgi:hypothetical protein